MSEVILGVENLVKTYHASGRPLTVVDDVSFSVSRGESLAIIGPSGSGKTTLLGLCAGLDVPTSGSVSLMDFKLNRMDEDDRAYIRNQHVGFVFQNFQLLPTLTALENVMVPLELRKDRRANDKARGWMDRVGLGERYSHYPSQLSGGEQQRVALARAFATSPAILFVDEPTGNLDGDTAGHITQLLFELNKEEGTTLVMVTHNQELARRTGQLMYMRNAKLLDERAMATV